MNKQVINIVWFKRDLRLEDHQPLMQAMNSRLPVLLLYCFEPSLLSYPDSDERHVRFIQESIADMNVQLQKFHHRLYSVTGEIVDVLRQLRNFYAIHTIYSHEETGNQLSYKRDIDVQNFCNHETIFWKEFPSNGVIRRLKKRSAFSGRWMETMCTPLYTPDFTKASSVTLEEKMLQLTPQTSIRNHSFQPGGITSAEKYLTGFLYNRKSNYNKHISKPEESRISCSRLSPYLAWGNLSMKQVYQAALKAIHDTGDAYNLRSFINRLHWHCHFIQKFESECRMEFENLNKGFDAIRTEVNPSYITAWEKGQTGYPLIDACMRCVVHTGYLNFRMRSMVVSFLTHHLWQPWQAGVHFMARQFLDYEPGIHYSQFQMQAGTMGVNTIRIYNPVKQSTEHDPHGVFIKKWIRELQEVPEELIHTPWLMSPAEQKMYKVELGKTYPEPVIDIKATHAHAREQLWKIKGSSNVRLENKRILKKHTNRSSEKEKMIQLKF